MSIKRAIDELKAGATYRAAAERHGVSLSVLHKAARRAGVSPRKKGRALGLGLSEATARGMALVKRGFTYRAAAESSGASIGRIHDALARRGETPKRRGWRS